MTDLIYKTRFPELSYTHFAGDWRIVVTEDGAYIGPYYRSRAELLGDLERYATDYGVFVEHGIR